MKNSDSKNWINVLGIPVFSRKKEYIFEKIDKYLFGGGKSDSYRSKIGKKPFTIFTPNAEILVYAQKDKRFSQILKQADVTVPDGTLVVWAMNFFPTPNSQLPTPNRIKRIAGVDLMADLVFYASKRAVTIGVIGGRGGLALEALECLKRQFPTLKGWVEDGPELEVRSLKLEVGWSKKVKEIVRTIQMYETDILFVAFGHPKQEYFIDEVKKELIAAGYDRPIVLMAVGGALDFIAGRVPRAPVWMREHGLEWLFRLIVQPWRIKRQLALGEFVFRVMRT